MDYHLELLGNAAMHLAAKYEEEVDCPRLSDFLTNSYGTCYTREEVLAMESEVLNALDYVVHDGPNAISFLWGFAMAEEEDEYLWVAAKHIARRSLSDYGCCMRFLPSMVAASSVFLGRFCLERGDRPWTEDLEMATGYKASELKDCILLLHGLLLDKDKEVDICREIPDSYFEDHVNLHE